MHNRIDQNILMEKYLGDRKSLESPSWKSEFCEKCSRWKNSYYKCIMSCKTTRNVVYNMILGTNYSSTIFKFAFNLNQRQKIRTLIWSLKFLMIILFLSKSSICQSNEIFKCTVQSAIIKDVFLNTSQINQL